MRIAVIAAALALWFVGLSVAADAGAAVRRTTNISAQGLGPALNILAKNCDMQVVYRSEVVGKLQTQGAVGELTTEEALAQLLSGTGLTYRYLDENTVTIEPASAPAKISGIAPQAPAPLLLARVEGGKDGAAQREAAAGPENEPSREAAAAPEILVKGSKILNMDLKRSRDDAQPYVIFDREAITTSGASNVEEFLNKRLTMNTGAGVNNQTGANHGNMSAVNLRGLGTKQTLILVDGHRLANPNIGSTSSGGSNVLQADLNGIPITAIERIEVLPTTASGIYGSTATGGVINVILRRDYTGAEAQLTYGNTFDADATQRRVDASLGFSLADGNTSITLAGSYADSDPLLAGERDFTRRGLDKILQNNPATILGVRNPPLGATTNIRSDNGSPLFGAGTSNITNVPVGYAGGGGLAPLQTNAGRYNFDLAPTTQSGGGKVALLGAPTVRTLSATVRQQFTPKIQGFLDALASDNESRFPINQSAAANFTVAATAPNNPFNQAIRVTIPVSAAMNSTLAGNQTRQAVGGLIFQLPREWRSEVDYTWNRFRANRSVSSSQLLSPAATTAILNGSLDVLRDLERFPLDFTPYLLASSYISPSVSRMRNATLRASGPVGSLPAGRPVLSVMLEHQDVDFSDNYRYSATATNYTPDRSQSVRSVYLEARVPLVSRGIARKGLRELELQIAGRRDDYKVDGATGFIVAGATTPIMRFSNSISSDNPTLGLRYRPVEDLLLRASYGTGFVPPEVTQLAPDVPVQPGPASTYPDPLRGNEFLSNWEYTYGGNPSLKPETSESWSAGGVFTPGRLPGLRVSLDYTRIDKKDNIDIVNTFIATDFVGFLTAFPERVTRAAAAPGDPYGVGRITHIDFTLVNVARAKVEAYDLAMDYRMDTARFGGFSFYAQATRQTHFLTQLVPSVPETENVGISSSSPLKLRANGGVTWDRNAWSAGWSVRYFDSYLVSRTAATIANQGDDGRIPSQHYHDLFFKYRFDPQSGMASVLGRLELQTGVNNVFNTQPPFDAGGGGFNGTYYSRFGDPRLANYYLTLKAAF